MFCLLSFTGDDEAGGSETGNEAEKDVEAEEWRAIEADRFLRGLDKDGNQKLEGQSRNDEGFFAFLW